MVQNEKRLVGRDFYTAAVVEYTSLNIIEPHRTWDAHELMNANAEQYVKIIQNASHYDVDIIVFPECGLTGTPIPKYRAAVKPLLTRIPSADQQVVPYLEPHKYDKVLVTMSKAAKDCNMYVVVNLLEIVPCSPDDESAICHSKDPAYHYNTNVVFNRRGEVVAKYRKYHLFLEPAFDHTPQPEHVSFDTDFGVRFGMFICFDILFPEPSVTLVQQQNITDFVYSAAWMSELPLLTAVTVHSSWAFSMDVNLLSSNYNNPAQFGGGSGIYAGRNGIKVAVMPQYTGSQLLISRVPKKKSSPMPKAESHVVPLIPPPRNNTSQLRLLCDSSYSSFHSQPLECLAPDELTVNTFSYAEPKHGYSCNIEVTWSNKDPNNNMPSYRMFGYAGERTFSGAKTCYIEACGISAVKTDKETMSGCGSIPDLYDRTVTIRSIRISVTSPETNTLAIPSTLNSKVIPLDVADYTFTTNGTKVEMTLLNPTTDLITFAVYKLPKEISKA